MWSYRYKKLGVLSREYHRRLWRCHRAGLREVDQIALKHKQSDAESGIDKRNNGKYLDEYSLHRVNDLVLRRAVCGATPLVKRMICQWKSCSLLW
jgi:hypothetical protein